MGFKSSLKKVPLLGKLLISVNSKLKKKKFKSTEDYWKNRYGSGGNSGQGSYNEFAEHKADVINRFVEENKIKTVLELGCGDGNQLSYFKFPQFVGYEVSQDAVNLCKTKFANDPSKSFYLISDFKPATYDLTISLDVVYCLIEGEIYEDYLSKLFSSSSKYVLVFSSNHNENNHANPHIKHRKFTDWVEKNKPEFKILKVVENKFKNRPDVLVSDFYFFEKSV